MCTYGVPGTFDRLNSYTFPIGKIFLSRTGPTGEIPQKVGGYYVKVFVSWVLGQVDAKGKA
jgi:hypothetical protein